MYSHTLSCCVMKTQVILQRERIEKGRLIDPPLAHHHAASSLNGQSESAPAARGNCRLFQRYRRISAIRRRYRVSLNS